MRMLHTASRLLLAATALVALIRTVPAQSTAADIVGTVTDPSGGVVSNVLVKVIQEETNFTRETHSNSEGIYEFRILQPGAYTVSAEAAGFKKYVNEHVPLAPRQVLRIDIPISIGDFELNIAPFGTFGIGYLFDGPHAGIDMTWGVDGKFFIVDGFYAFARPFEMGFQCLHDSGDCAIALVFGAGVGFAFPSP